MNENNKDRDKIISIIEDSKKTLDGLDIAMSKKKEIDMSLDTIANEVGKIRTKLSNMKKTIDNGKESIKKHKSELNNVLISFDLKYIIPIRDILVANLPDEISTEDKIRHSKIRYNDMYNKDIEERIENTEEIKNIIFLFESRYNDEGRNKGKEFVCIGRIIIDSIDIENESYTVKININHEEKKVKKEYREVSIPVDNKLRIYNIISTLNTILYYGK